MSRRFHSRVRRALAAASLALCLPGCGDSPVGPSVRIPDGGGVITFGFDGRPALTMRVAAGAEAVAAAEQYLATGEGPRFPAGPIVRGAGVDPRYPYHFIPDSVELAAVAIELCDGAPMFTRAEVDAFMRGATGQLFPRSAPWCPWGAFPLEVERVEESK